MNITLESKTQIIKILELVEISSVEKAIQRIYYKWIIKTNSEYKDLEKYSNRSILDDFYNYNKKFNKDPLFLFFVGYILDVEPWVLIENYVEDMENNDLKGRRYIKKAFEITPKVFYQWGIELDIEKRKNLASIILN